MMWVAGEGLVTVLSGILLCWRVFSDEKAKTRKRENAKTQKRKNAKTQHCPMHSVYFYAACDKKQLLSRLF